jgi:hypothetical protein
MENAQATNAQNAAADQLKTETTTRQSKDKRFGRQVAFGIQQTLACWATDFIDPPVSRWLQNNFGNKDHHVTHKHVWYAEALGDTSAFFSYLAIKNLFAKPVDWVIGGVKHALDGRLEKLGKKTLKQWADQHHLTEKDARYQQKLEDYKQFQAENLVDSTIVASSATVANVLIQRKLGNQQTYAVILGSKLVGAAATMGVMLGLRTTLPTSTKALDDELSERYFSKLIRWTQRQFGIRDTEVTTGFSVEDNTLPPQLAYDKKERFLATLQKRYSEEGIIDIPSFVAKQKQVCQAFVQALYPEGRFAKAIAAQYKKDGEPQIQEMMLHRRDAMLARLELLDNPQFLSELQLVLLSDKPLVPAGGVSPEKKEKLIVSLMQTPCKKDQDHEKAIRKAAHHLHEQQEALCKAFNPDSDAASQLALVLGGQLQENAQSIARAYMQERQEAARNVMSELSDDGEVVTEAIRRSEALRGANAASWRAMVSDKASSRTAGYAVAA